MQVIAAPVSKSQLKVVSPVVTLILGHFFIPMKRRHDFTQFITSRNGDGTQTHNYLWNDEWSLT